MEGHAIEGDLESMIFNSLHSTIPKLLTFKLLRWMQNLHQCTPDHAILYANVLSKDEQLLICPFLAKNKKYGRRVWLNVKIHIVLRRQAVNHCAWTNKVLVQ
jgi:hypothetical protein